MKKAIILLGPQGSGKGTQAKMLLDFFNKNNPSYAHHLEMGSILREKREIDGGINELFGSYMDRGERVPDHIIEEIFFYKFDSLKGEAEVFILDGCVRTVSQALKINNFLLGKRIAIYTIVLDIPKHMCRIRIESRISSDICKGLKVRPDDIDDDAVENRLRAYFSSLHDILEVLKNYEIVDARDSYNVVFQNILSKLD